MKEFLRIEPGWVAVMCALYYVNPLGAFWPFLAAVLCHELGHALALLALGVPVRQFRLELGGEVLRTGHMDYRRDMLCTLAGPAANLLCLVLRHQLPTFAVLCLVLALFNLLPIYPLDGGRFLRAALLLRLEQRRAEAVTTAVGLAVGAALLAGGLWLCAALHAGIWPVLLAAALLLRVALAGRSD